MGYYLGIDGGGTKTTYAIMNTDGLLIGQWSGPTCHHQQLEHFDRFSCRLKEGIQTVLSQTDLHLSDISYATFGLPGYGEYPERIPAIHSAIGSVIGQLPFMCVNDVEIAWAAGHGLSEGIHLVSGTGSIAFGKDSNGNAARSGGWGPQCGDEGSAYWLGRQAINLFTKQCDGRLPKDTFYHDFRHTLALNDDFDLLHWVADPVKGNRTAVAALSTLLYQACDYNSHARHSFELAANELSHLALGVLSQLDFPSNTPVYVTYSGGVFQAGHSFRAALQTRLFASDPRLILKAPELTPILGACHMARRAHLL